MRSPSTVAHSGTRGREPVESRIASASISSSPSAVCRRRRCTRSRAGRVPRDQPHALRLEQAGDTVSAASLHAAMRWRSAGTSRQPSASSPIVAARASSESPLPVATIALLGMQSQRCAAPPITSRSISVTSAPSDAATVAAVLPAGAATEDHETHGHATPGYVGVDPRTLANVQELRTDELTGAAGDRRARPRDPRPRCSARPPARAGASTPPETCPFCPGHEAMTPPEVARLGRAARPTHRAGRCASCRTSTRSSADGVPGAHEVVVISPAHDGRSTVSRPTRRRPRCCRVARPRRAPPRRRPRARGADRQPRQGRRARRSSTRTRSSSRSASSRPTSSALLARFAAAGRDLVADAIDAARARRVRGPRRRGRHRGARPRRAPPFSMRVALPYAPRSASTARPTPRSPCSPPRSQDALGAPRRGARRLAYNVVVHTAPRPTIRPFHWWVDIVPRLSVYGGFELGHRHLVNIVRARDRPPACCATPSREDQGRHHDRRAAGRRVAGASRRSSATSTGWPTRCRSRSRRGRREASERGSTA